MHGYGCGDKGLCGYLWARSTIFNLAGVEALLVGVFHAGKDSCATESHRVDGTLIVEQHSVCDDLESTIVFTFGAKRFQFFHDLLCYRPTDLQNLLRFFILACQFAELPNQRSHAGLDLSLSDHYLD